MNDFTLDQKSILQATCLLQPLPASVHRLTALALHPEPNIAEMVDAVQYDPVLTSRLLRVANSAMYASCTEVRTVREAVMRMGTGMVLGLAMGTSAKPLVTAKVPGYGISSEDFWRHSVTTALVSEVGRSLTKTRWSPAGFTAGLLHDFGKLILGHFLTPEVLSSIAAAQKKLGLEPFQAEQDVLGIHHGKVGALIAEHWELPNEIVEGIQFHHDPETATGVLPFATCFANVIARVIAGEEDEKSLRSERLQQALDLLDFSTEDVFEICKKVASRVDELDAAYK